MLVVFDIDENVLRPEAAHGLAEREALWFFCKNFRVLPGWEITGDNPEETVITPPEKPEPLVKLVPPPAKTRRTTPRKVT